MRLDLRGIIHLPGGVKTFEFDLDLSDLDFYGRKPICEPVHVKGKVENRADMLILEATASSELDLLCDACGKPFRRVKTIEVQRMLATELQDEEDDDIILLDGSILDAGEVFTTEFVLEMDTINLCREDCKGLCLGCGADLNTEPCQCKPDMDPRLSALSALLE
ncbi:MAG: DUF177 domain-containing protein [Oscillospiraceae bacterium]|nr:DUF177 domain-containing protein [Oscillospiraceae bacterium]